MPLPFLLGAGLASITSAATAATISTVATRSVVSVRGSNKIKASAEQIEEAKERHNKNIDTLHKAQEKTKQTIHSYEKEIKSIRSSFEHFSDLIEELQNRPKFKPYQSGQITLPEFSASKMKQSTINPLAIDVGVFLASTSPLGCVITYFVSHSLSEKADEIWDEMRQCEKQITKIDQYLAELRKCIQDYKKILTRVSVLYYPRLYKLEHILRIDNRKDWFLFTEEEQLMVENLVCLVSLLYEMIKVDFLSEEDENGFREINKFDSDVMTEVAVDFLQNTQLNLDATVSTPTRTTNSVVADYPSVIFSIQGKRSGDDGKAIVWGTLTEGELNVGDKLYLHNRSNSCKPVEIIGFDRYPSEHFTPSTGIPAAIIIKGISNDLISIGDRITNTDKNT